jgi:hypothetical protein
MPSPQHTSGASARRKQLKNDPNLIKKITASPIATAQWCGDYYGLTKGKIERDLKPAAILGTIYRHMRLALSKLQGTRCPEATELKRLLKLYKPQVDAVPIYITEGSLPGPTLDEYWEKNCVIFVKSITKAHREGKIRSVDKIAIQDGIVRYHTMLEMLHPAPHSNEDIIELHQRLDALQLLLAPHQGIA